MLKVPFLQNNTETIVGLALLTGVLILFFVNAFFVVTSLVSVYGNKKALPQQATIDATVFSQALKVISPQ